MREIYHPHYYGAYVLDPDGNNIEAVCHRPAALAELTRARELPDHDARVAQQPHAGSSRTAP